MIWQIVYWHRGSQKRGQIEQTYQDSKCLKIWPPADFCGPVFLRKGGLQESTTDRCAGCIWYSPDDFRRVCSTTPSIHRRIFISRKLCSQPVTERYKECRSVCMSPTFSLNSHPISILTCKDTMVGFGFDDSSKDSTRIATFQT